MGTLVQEPKYSSYPAFKGYNHKDNIKQNLLTFRWMCRDELHKESQELSQSS